LYNDQFEERRLKYEESPPGSGHYVAYEEITPTRTLTDSIDLGTSVASDISKVFTHTLRDVRTAVLGAKDFQLILSAFKGVAGVSIISNPKIIVANEEPAVIHIGETERPFISIVTPGQQGIAPVVTYNPGEPVDTGVKLTVTPTVNTESNITVKIEPELTAVLKNAVAPNGQTYPVIRTKKIKTVFTLESGKTVAIGGLTETRDDDQTKKVPLLGDIPIIGKYLFSHTRKSKAQRETIIFVTVGLAEPSEMRYESGMPEDARLVHKQLIASEAQKKAFKEELELLKQAAANDGAKKGEQKKQPQAGMEATD
ncbi:MAG: type II and III secretion system protein, partial [Kiritimatiellae bacterium]|nr:type II and III secretion system protein [Kiritimatiellia bacterium]